MEPLAARIIRFARHPVGGSALAGAAAILVYFITAWAGAEPLDLYLVLADAFLHGRADVPPGRAPSWRPSARSGTCRPPAPAIVYMPLVAIFGTSPGIAYVIPPLAGGLSVGLAHLLLRRMEVAPWPAAWLTAGLATTTLWWVVTEGGTWHSAQVVAVLFALLALNVATTGRWPVLAGVLLGLAAASRLPVGLALPLFLYLYRRSWGTVALLLVGLAVIAIPVGMYNMARFASPFDFGYALIPSYYHPESTVLAESWFRDGILSPTYIPRSLGVMFLSGFTIVPDAPFLRPSVSGLSIVLSAPIFLFALRAPRSPLAVASWVAVALVMLPNLAHGSWGFWQFGYRFLLDATPFLLVLLGLAYRERIGPWAMAAVVLGAAVTGYGLWAMKLGEFVDRGLPFAA
jgi:hypothetical protein